MRNLLKALIVFLVIAPVPAMAGFEEGRAAFIKGDWQAVKTEMLPLAKEGDAKAQIAMGLLYARGHGVEQNWQAAIYWFAEAAEAAAALESRAERTVVRILANENHTYSVKRATQIALITQ
ncbi:MAG: hypothetical protein CMM48_09550 [Rhodospirillaceae bacterium]|nr:hypothetical protein [Rhodospirillaceae bacterium]